MNNLDLNKYEKMIRDEADSLLYDKGLVKLLSEYGRVEFAGSYPLKMMWKKDLDISLVAPDLTPDQFFILGGKIAQLLKPHSVYYRDTRVLEVNDRPKNSLYFGIFFDDWKIDLWVIDEQWWAESEKYMRNILERLTEEKKRIILEIKKEFSNSTDYGKKYTSKLIYSSVLDGRVTSVREFKNLINN
ncbi:MAG: hypothetical protein ABFS12_06070 [Bacteroidota bacterium]